MGSKRKRNSPFQVLIHALGRLRRSRRKRRGEEGIQMKEGQMGEEQGEGVQIDEEQGERCRKR